MALPHPVQLPENAPEDPQNATDIALVQGKSSQKEAEVMAVCLMHDAGE